MVPHSLVVVVRGSLCGLSSLGEVLQALEAAAAIEASQSDSLESGQVAPDRRPAALRPPQGAVPSIRRRAQVRFDRSTGLGEDERKIEPD